MLIGSIVLIGDSIFCRDRRLGRARRPVARRVHGGEWGLVGNVGFFAFIELRFFN